MTTPDRTRPLCATCHRPVVMRLVDGAWKKFNPDGTEHECEVKS